ncbi:MAG: hypothetical protein NT172_10070, partial [Planctomycetota bacterium]|nr:hypothetical protein [Planctomycetota bacterium]
IQPSSAAWVLMTSEPEQHDKQASLAKSLRCMGFTIRIKGGGMPEQYWGRVTLRLSLESRSFTRATKLGMQGCSKIIGISDLKNLDKVDDADHDMCKFDPRFAKIRLAFPSGQLVLQRL